MSSGFEIKLNGEGIRQLLKSSEIQNELEKRANEQINKHDRNHSYHVENKIKGTRAISVVIADDWETVGHNNKTHINWRK